LIGLEEYWMPPEIDEKKYLEENKEGKKTMTEVKKQTMIQDIKE
jgi:hypothetical protein